MCCFAGIEKQTCFQYQYVRQHGKYQIDEHFVR